MKFNKWTMSLAALGVVSLASATQARADGTAAPAPNYLESATKGISINGYVDTSVNYQATDTGNRSAPLDGIPFQGPAKRDGFNLDVVELNIEHDVDATPWASGYKFQMIAGPDAVGYNSAGGGGDFGVKQAYVELMAPVGNGLDIKMGVFDTIIGYEVFEAGNNPNFTRSWGWALEPTENTGILLTYKFNDAVSASIGVANTWSAGINARNTYKGIASYWWKTAMGSLTITAPNSWGFLGGSSFYVGAVNGYNTSGVGADQLNLYAGAVLNTPLKELTTGFAFDYVQSQYVGFNAVNGETGFNSFDIYNLGVYATYKASDKLSLNGRAEYGWFDNSGPASFDACYWELTGTVEYDLWANVMSRLEVRYDSADEGINPGNIGPDTIYGADRYDTRCGVGLYLNLIYKF